MVITLTLKDSKKKSSRSKADMFEVLVALKLSEHYGLNTDLLERELNNLKIELSKFLNGTRRDEEQQQRINILLPFLISEIDNKLVPQFGDPMDMHWVGREWQEKNSLSDIDIKFKSNDFVGISLKSTRAGRGTQKNLGLKSLEKFLGLDLTNEIEDMWQKTRGYLVKQGGELSSLSKENKMSIRENKYRFPIIQEIGKKYGYQVQIKGVKKSVESFNKLSSSRKLKFVEHILGITESKPLLNAGVTGMTPYLYWNESFNKLIKGKMEAKMEKDGKGYYIAVDEEPIIRIQANFTNGIGLSAFCERAFLIVDLS